MANRNSNEKKAREFAKNRGHDGQSITEAFVAALDMAEWKDEQFAKKNKTRVGSHSGVVVTRRLNGKPLYKVGDVLKFTYADEKHKERGLIKVSRITDESGVVYYYDEIKRAFIDEFDVEGKLEGDELVQYNKKLKEYLRLKKFFEA